jgi:hypothetical protein
MRLKVVVPLGAQSTASGTFDSLLRLDNSLWPVSVWDDQLFVSDGIVPLALRASDRFADQESVWPRSRSPVSSGEWVDNDMLAF